MPSKFFTVLVRYFDSMTSSQLFRSCSVSFCQLWPEPTSAAAAPAELAAAEPWAWATAVFSDFGSSLISALMHLSSECNAHARSSTLLLRMSTICWKSLLKWSPMYLASFSWRMVHMESGLMTWS